MNMKKIVMGLVMALFAINAMADRILWLDIRGDLSNVSGEAFGDFMDRNGVLDGLDMMAITLSGQSLTWYVDNGSGFEEEDVGPWLLPEGTGDGYAWSARNQQVNITGVSDSDTVRILAGYFDWDAIGDGPLDMNYYTTLAYTEATVSALSSADYIYEPFDTDPPKQHWTPTTWNAVPEPSTAILALLGVGMLFKRRKNTHA